ncbi:MULTISPECIES: CHASE2 domain-containing protein [Aphanothece]|uniref:CHASE2 domain-containing protein n=1 Tax=Aphanothece TaxID=1121 RepID=UPI0039855BF3
MRPLWLLGVLLPLVATLPPLQPTPLGQGLEASDAQLRVIGWRLAAAWGPGRGGPPEPVVLAIDADSLDLAQLLSPEERRASPLWRQMGAWPWPRALQADLAAWVLERGASRVLFNVVFSQPSRLGPQDDQAFVERLSPWKERVVLAAAFGARQSEGVELAQLRAPLPLLNRAAAPPAGLTALLQSPQGYTEAIPGRRWLAARLADFLPPWPEPLPYRGRAGSGPVPWLPRYIAFAPPAARPPLVPAWQLPEVPDGFWRGRTVLIGATAPALGDQMETPFGAMSGTEVQAAALASVLEGTALAPMASSHGVLLLLAWAAAVLLLLRQASQAQGTLLRTLGLMLGALLLTALGWTVLQLWLPLTGLILLPLGGGSLRGIGQWRRESRERAYLHQVLARRVSPTLLRDILREPGPLGTQVGGSRCTCVVLFTDLVGFTPLSAQLDPPALFALLNRYFEAIAVAVIEEQGLLDKFIGDALMAEFGVPRSRGDRAEALAAVRAALAMQERLEALNRELEAQGHPCLRHGIGLHVGEVIAGNLGSSQRLEFTVVGAAVNVASRLEGLTRQYPDHPILLSGAVLELLPASVRAVHLGAHQLKGWPVPLEVYGLEGLDGDGETAPSATG